MATPITVLAAVGQAARRGIVIKGGRYLEALAKVDTFVMDKAGTLTITSAMPQAGAACEKINFDPLVMGDGIEPTSDPILLFRSPAYAVSFAKRMGGQ